MTRALLVLLALCAPAWATQTHVIDTGSYTADASERTVTLRYQPALVIVASNSTGTDTTIAFKSDTMAGSTAAVISDGEGFTANGEAEWATSALTLISTGFTVEANSWATNANGATYYWVAVRAGRWAETGSYSGTDGAKSVATQTRKAPAMTWIFSDPTDVEDGNEDPPAWVSWNYSGLGQGSAAYYCSALGGASTESLTATGFTTSFNWNPDHAQGPLGGDGPFTHHWVALWNDATIHFGGTTYSGDGGASQAVAGGDGAFAMVCAIESTQWLNGNDDTQAAVVADIVNVTTNTSLHEYFHGDGNSTQSTARDNVQNSMARTEFDQTCLFSNTSEYCDTDWADDHPWSSHSSGTSNGQYKAEGARWLLTNAAMGVDPSAVESLTIHHFCSGRGGASGPNGALSYYDKDSGWVLFATTSNYRADDGVFDSASLVVDINGDLDDFLDASNYFWISCVTRSSHNAGTAATIKTSEVRLEVNTVDPYAVLSTQDMPSGAGYTIDADGTYAATSGLTMASGGITAGSAINTSGVTYYVLWGHK